MHIWCSYDQCLDWKRLHIQVQAGVGRTGKWWGHQHLMDSDPDIVTFAKGIASGFPLAGIATKPDFFSKLRVGSIGGTYSGSTLGCAAACATLDAIMEDNMLDNATHRGKQLVDVRSLHENLKCMNRQGKLSECCWTCMKTFPDHIHLLNINLTRGSCIGFFAELGLIRENELTIIWNTQASSQGLVPFMMFLHRFFSLCLGKWVQICCPGLIRHWCVCKSTSPP